MKYSHIILRYGEIFLKGKNRKQFEQQLVRNIKSQTGQKVHCIRSRLILDYFNEHYLLKRVFGLVSYSPALFVEKDIDVIKKAILPFVNSSFRIYTKRSDKRFPLTSLEVNQQVGEFIEKNTEHKFSFSDPEQKIHIEINEKGAYIFTETISCPGGLPTGMEGIVSVQVENEGDVLAGLLMMKRGCSIIPTSDNIKLLQKFSPKELKVGEASIIVSGERYSDYNGKEANKLILRPLIAYSEEQIKKELQKYISFTQKN